MTEPDIEPFIDEMHERMLRHNEKTLEERLADLETTVAELAMSVDALQIRIRKLERPEEYEKPLDYW